MSELPKGWVKAKISDVTFKCNQSKPDDDSAIKYIDIGSINRQSKKIEEPQYLYGKDAPSRARKIVNTNDVLVSLTRPNLNAVALVDESFDKQYASTGFEVLKPIGIDSRYLFALVRTNHFINTISGAVKGALYPAAKSSDVQDYEFPLAPLNEQIRIGDKLDSIQAKVNKAQERLEKIPGILKRFRQSVLAAATSGELTKEWRESNINESTILSEIQERKINWARENAQHNEANRILKRAMEYNNHKPRINVELPDTWTWESLEDCVLMIVDCHNKTAPYVQSGIPLIRTSNIRDGKFIWEELRFVDEETYAFWSKRCPPEQGDIIFTREAPMGEAAIIPPGQKVCLGQRTMLIRPIESHISARYLLLTIMDPGFKRRSDLLAVGTGVKHYRVGDVSNLKIPIPSTNEQIEIVRRVHDLFALAEVVEKNYSDSIKRVNLLSQSILAKAFRGELLEQNTSDEPATELLMRIKQQQSEAPKVARQARKSATKVMSAAEEIEVESAPLESGILTLLKKTNSELSAQQIMEQLTDKTFRQVDALFTELKHLLETKAIAKVGIGEACMFKAVKR